MSFSRPGGAMRRAGWSAPLRAALTFAVMSGPLAAQAVAQSLPGMVPETTAPTAEPSPAPAADLRVELERLLQQLEDPEKAQKLAEGLRAVLEAEGPSAQAPASGGDLENAGEVGAASSGAATSADTIREAVKQARPAAAELLAEVEDGVSERFALAYQALHEIHRTAERAPEILRWAGDALDEPAEWRSVAREAGVLIAILGAALIVMWLVARALAPARDALAIRDGDKLMSRVLVAMGLLVIRAMPILAFALLANALILVLTLDPVTEVALSSGVSAIVVVRIGVALAGLVLTPAVPWARWVPLSDAAARVLLSYVHWFLAVGVYGQTLISVLRWYGLPWALEGVLMRLIGLILFVSAVWMVIRHRRAVADAIATLAEDDEGADWTRMPWRRIGAIWHVVALLYLVALFVIFMVQGQAQFVSVLIGSTLSLAILVILVVALRYEQRASADLALTEEDEDEDQEAEAHRRPTRGRSLLSWLLRLAILIVAALTFLQVWGLDTWNWLLLVTGGAGEQLLDIGIILVVTYAVWLISNRFVSGYIGRLDAQVASGRSSTRTRTVLVLARNALLVTLYLIAGLVILSELGVDIAPLLAGAGVIGIAIGFGSQRLVQDVITGLFNLLEDTFAVGDVVDLGGKAGVVEAVTIRTVRLRDLGGNVHTIPFGAIDVVTNMTKDFAYALFDVGVAYRESVDDVMAAITDLADSMRRERAYRRVILEPLEMLGLDQFADSAVMVKCRLKVRAGSQWMIGREFNRRLKNRFDELGIEIPFPHQTVYFGEDRSGKAPPARVVIGADQTRPEEPEAATPVQHARGVVADPT